MGNSGHVVACEIFSCALVRVSLRYPGSYVSVFSNGMGTEPTSAFFLRGGIAVGSRLDAMFFGFFAGRWKMCQ